MTLSERAAELRQAVDTEIRNAGILMPKVLRYLIERQASLLEDMAREIDKQREAGK
jgi:hypothetical protein